jgi:hypothetical protein
MISPCNRNNIRKTAAVLLLPFLFIILSCEKKAEDRYSIKNILKASVAIVKNKGFSALSGEEINQEIDHMYSAPEDILESKKTIRQQNADGSNNYRIIFEDLISKEHEESDRRYKDPVKNNGDTNEQRL